MKMRNLSNKMKKNSLLEARRQMILLSMMFILTLFLISFTSSADWDNRKEEVTTTFDNLTSRENPLLYTYPAIKITNTFGLGSTLFEGYISQHDEVCGSSCASTIKIKLGQEGVLIDDVVFNTLQEDGKWIEQNVRSYKFYINTKGESYEVNDYKYECVNGKDLLNGTFVQDCSKVLTGTHTEYKPIWTRYNLGDKVPAGVYEIKLEVEKKPTRTIDWLIKTNGDWLDEWAVYTAGATETTYIAEDGKNYTTLTYLTSGTFNTTTNLNVSILVVAGGGGGGTTTAGGSGSGAGAGGVIYNNSVILNGLYTINIGEGGVGQTTANGTDGSPSSFGNAIFTMTAAGGAKGIRNQQGANGGSGSGGANGVGGTSTQNSINGTGYGNSGGAGTGTNVCGGGGGAGAVGADYSGSNAGAGGGGQSFNMNGTNVYYGGGGGGASAIGSDGAGGIGGGAAGSDGVPSAATANTGGGGGGASGSPIAIGGAGGKGIVIVRYLTSELSEVTLNSPANNYVSPNNLITFNTTATTTGGATIKNMSLWTNESGSWALRNVTIGLTGTSYTETWVRDLTDTTLWNAQMCDSDDVCYFAEANRTLFIDTDAPTIIVSSPAVLEDYGAVGGNETLNVTFTDGNLDSCWYNYNGTNISIAGCQSGISNSTNLILEANDFDITIYANDSAGNLNSTSRSWNYTILENSRTYNATSTQTTTEQFKLNITTNGSQIPIVYLVYNGTSYLTTLSGGEYVVNISMLNAGTNNFYWNISYGTEYIITSTSSQLVSSLTGMTLIEGDCGVGLTKVMNFSFINEINLTAVENVTAKYNFKYGITNITGAVAYGSLENIGSFSLCLNTTQSPTYDIGYGEIDYSHDSYSTRRYYVFESTRVSNVTTYIPLYLLPNGDSTSFLVEIRSPTLSIYQNKYTTLLRWYPSLNEYKVVEMGKTDEKGQTINKVKVEDVDYRIGVYELDGTLIYLATPIRMACLESPCSYTLTIQDSESYTFDDIYNIQTSLTYSSGVFTLTYNDPSQKTETMELNVYKIGGVGSDVLVCSSNSSAFTGILNCNVSSESGMLKAVAVRTASPSYIITSKIVDTMTTIFQGTFGLFLQFLISVVLIFAGVFSPVVSIILGIISLSFGIFLFKTITYPIFIGIAILGGLIIHFMMKSSK